jgi:hypothetical protein
MKEVAAVPFTVKSLAWTVAGATALVRLIMKFTGCVLMVLLQAGVVVVTAKPRPMPSSTAKRNHRHIRQQIGAQSIIPAKRGKPGWKLHGVRAQMRAAFPGELYRQRVHAETVFSAVKRKLSAKAPGRSLATQRKQALLLGLAYNIYKLRPLHFRLRLYP